MSQSTTNLSWTEANQAFLVAEFARLKSYLESRRATRDTGPESSVPAPPPIPPPAPSPPAAIDWVSDVFGLSPFERDLLLLCAGVEMDARLAAACAEAQGQFQRACVTFGLALAALPEAHWSALAPTRALRRFRLLELQAGHGLSAAPLRIDERILHLLAGINLLDPRLAGRLQFSPGPEWLAEQHQGAADRMARMLQDQHDPPPVVQLCGDDAPGQEDVAAFVAQQSGRQLFILRAEAVPAAGPDLEELELLWRREALLLPGALVIQCGSEPLSPSVRHLAERLPGLLFLASREPSRLERACIRVDVNKPPPPEQKVLWQKVLGPTAAGLNGALDAVAAQFRLSARTIVATGRLLDDTGGAVVPPALWEACRAWSRPRLSDLAQRIAPSAGWDDLVLPESQKQALRLIASQVRHRMKVYETWGFAARGPRGLGVSALFTGESGTGKTMAAEVLAGDLGLDLYRIDLSSVVSKYIGETEKNLKQVFDAAEEGGALLLFDEADALFGKRSDVKDSHDRYANIEVSYLLQRMEAYQGLAILTTNLKSAMDRAFQRRLRFAVNFPFPDAGQREAIWRRIFPAQTPTRDLNYTRLAQLNVAGGNIRNIALNAAFLAAEDGDETAVRMAHVARAARLEAEKVERPLAEAETRGWV
ncbi:MAG: ATP-binding protein [Verrucomicrobia bacterium]|nr:ATP-binding protein [Verrucomicrobiota bacterium]